MSQPDDPRLEHELRDALGRRDPGPAPHALRERVLRVPDEISPKEAGNGRQILSALIGLAAVVALAVVVLSVGGQFGTGPATSPALPSGDAVAPSLGVSPAPASPEPTPFVTARPVPQSPKPGETPLAVNARIEEAGPAFDPARVGVGVQVMVDNGDGHRFLIGFAILILGSGVLTVRGRKRVVPGLVAVALLVWLSVASLAPVDLTTTGGGGGLYVAWAPKVTGYTESVLYELAPARQPFAFDVSDVHADSLLPVRLVAVEAPNARFEDFAALKYTAAWLDRDDSGHGGSSGPVTPLTSIDLSGFRSIWLVGRAGACAPGPDYRPSDAGEGWTSLDDTVMVEISVLGIPRRVPLKLDFSVVEPNSIPCSGDPAKSGEPTAAPASATP